MHATSAPIEPSADVRLSADHLTRLVGLCRLNAEMEATAAALVAGATRVAALHRQVSTGLTELCMGIAEARYQEPAGIYETVEELVGYRCDGPDMLVGLLVDSGGCGVPSEARYAELARKWGITG